VPGATKEPVVLATTKIGVMKSVVGGPTERVRHGVCGSGSANQPGSDGGSDSDLIPVPPRKTARGRGTTWDVGSESGGGQPSGRMSRAGPRALRVGLQVKEIMTDYIVDGSLEM